MSVDILLGVPGKLKQILDRLTNARATNLDRLQANVDADVSTRATQSSVNTIDSRVSTINTNVNTTNSRLTAARAAKLDLIKATAIPRCTIVKTQSYSSGYSIDFNIGYSVKSTSNAAIICNCWERESLSSTQVHLQPCSASWASASVVRITKNRSGAYLFGSVTIINYNP